MILKCLNKTITVFLTLIFIIGLFPPAVFAQPNKSSELGEIKGFNRSVFDSHFSRADRELNPEHWLKEARFGLTQAICAWELTANNFYDNPLLFKEAKNQLEKWSNEELEKRFSQWLLGRFFGEASEKSMMDISKTFSESQKNYLWHLDDEGNIIFDEKTGDPMIVRPNEEDRDYSNDLLIWRGEADDIINIKSAFYDNIMINLFPELLAYIPLELRETMGEVISETVTGRKTAVKNEFENIAAREESIFTSRRTRDILSLRSKNEYEAARLYTERLITETETVCNTGIDEIKTKIEQAAAGTGDLAVLGEEWLSLYKEQFERGLKAWEEAEERFFIRRIEWEQESFKLFSEGEEIWLAAFNQFEEERNKWELKAKELFHSGELMFLNLSDEFNRNIEEAKKEFYANMEMRTGEGTAKVKAIIDMYLLCASAAITAKENAGFWRDQNNEVEMNKSNEMYLSYMEKALDARNRILSDYADLLGTGALKDILSDDVSSEDFCLDEYQIALVRAKALVQYWERKTEIAQAVMSYANELSAGRMTEAEGIRAWEEAKNEYNRALAFYEAELAKLNSTGDELRINREALQELTRKMIEEEEKLMQLNSDYLSLVSFAAVNRQTYYYNEYKIKYNNLAETYKLLQKTGINSDYWNILENGALWEIAERNENAGLIRSIFDNGTELSVEEIEVLAEQLKSLDQAASKENLLNVLSSLSRLFNDYGINTSNNILPGINIICEAILSENGNFVQNTVRFINKFNNCLTNLPEWLGYEIENWLSSFIEYTAIKAFKSGFFPESKTDELALDYEEMYAEYIELYYYAVSLDDIDALTAETLNEKFNEIMEKMSSIYYADLVTAAWEKYKAASGSNEKHWRQYLLDEYKIEAEPALVLSSTLMDGFLTDALIIANYFSNRLNDAFNIYSQINTHAPPENAGYYYELYLNGIYNNSLLLNSLETYHAEIISIIENYKLYGLTKEETDERLADMKKNIKIQEDTYEAVRIKYLKEADKFFKTGTLYDEQYDLSNIAYKNADYKRFEYEKQDAIQRWAGTAYLNTGDIDFEKCREKLSKAQIVLDVLSDLYGNEEKRMYESPEYDALYSAYEQSFSRKIKVMEAVEILTSAIAQEKTLNEKYYSQYYYSLMNLGYVDQKYHDYFLPGEQADWNVMNIITLENNRLAFYADDSMNLSGLNELEAKMLDIFFNAGIMPEGERFNITQYEKSLRELCERISGYLTNDKKFEQWSLARDYLIKSFINENKDLKFLSKFFSGLGQFDTGGSLRNLNIVKEIIIIVSVHENLFSSIKNNTVIQNADKMYHDAWESLTEEEKADLEYYVILTLSGTGNDYLKGFSEVYTNEVYKQAYSHVNYYYTKAKNGYSIPLIGLFFTEMYKVNSNTLNKIKNIKDVTQNNINNWINGLKENLSSIDNYASIYKNSCKMLDIYEAKKGEGQSIKWEDIELTLKTTERMNEKEIAVLKTYWDTMQKNTGNKYYNSIDALMAMFSWASKEEISDKNALENKWLADSYNQKNNEYNFLSAADNYIAGKINTAELKTAAENAYGKNAPAWKNHLNNKHAVLVKNLSIYMNTGFNFSSEFGILGDVIGSLTEKTLESRYLSEYNAREAQWQNTLNDLMEKYYEWQNSSAIILENGRTDWINSSGKMEEAYKKWKLNFQNEYERINQEWSEAYLTGLEDKEKWILQAADAADQSSAESFLSLVGKEGERLSRFMDMREPFGIRKAVPQAQSLMEDLLKSSGIYNMSAAFGALSGIAGSVSVITRGGISGHNSWDSALIRGAASEIAKKTNEEIANNEARKLAYRAGLAAAEAIKELTANVDAANKNFRDGMDNHFVFNGLWAKRENGYVKEIIKGSTLFNPVITKMVTIQGFNDYVMEPVKLKTNTDENYLATLNSIAIHALLENIYAELDSVAVDIFGIGEETKKISRNREQSPGKFGAYIGYSPAVKPSGEIGNKRNEMFYDEGSGELGRLMSEFIYWKVVDDKGYAELALAPWDRRMWNDEGSFFKAISLRQAGQIAGAVVSSVVLAPFTAGASVGAGIGLTVAIAGVNAATELLFGTLDVAFGYKTLDEAAFNWSKSFITNLSTGIVSGAFSGISTAVVNSAASTAGKVAVQTLMTGAQTYTTTLVSSALNGITYDSVNGLGYNKDIFNAGMSGMGAGVFSSMTTAMTTSALTAINSGLDKSKLTGYNLLNKEDMKNLNELIGSLAGQGVNYAFGNDISLNVLNLNLLSGGKHSSGLLELHLGNDGVSMNFGTGGANVSFENILSSFRGAQVWNVNNSISNYGNKNNFDSLISLRAQYGYGDNLQKEQLYGILNDNTILNAKAKDDYTAMTDIDENGKRTINLAGYQQGMSEEEQFFLAAILGHEAYRDGYASDDNYLETRSAAMAHTEMALRMLLGGENIAFNENLSRDISEYIAAIMANDMSLFSKYVDSNYDSSADFWKLMHDGRLVNDNSGWLTDEIGRPILNDDGLQIGANEIEQGLLNILFGGTHNVNYKKYSDAQVILAQSLMLSAGMKFTNKNDNDIRTRLWKSNVTGQSLDMRVIMERAGSTVASPVFARYYENNAIAYVMATLGMDNSYSFDNYLTYDASSRFYNKLVPSVLMHLTSMSPFLNASDKFEIIQKHGGNNYYYSSYENGAHFGTDFRNRRTGDPIFMGISGSVVYTDKEVAPGVGNGNWMVVEYGYMFEGSFIGSGIYGEYMHMVDKPEFSKNTYLKSMQILGTVGNTGFGDIPHLHYSIFTFNKYPYSQSLLNVILNNNTGNTVTSNYSGEFRGTYKGMPSKKVTYDIENYLNRF